MEMLFKFIFLSITEKKILVQSLFWVILIRLCLGIIPFKSLNLWLSGFARREQAEDQQIDWTMINSVVRSVKACSRLVPYASCLTQALAARTLLGQMQQASQLKIGVNKNAEEKLIAHAWLEVEGEIIIGRLPHLRQFAVLTASDSVLI